MMGGGEKKKGGTGSQCDSLDQFCSIGGVWKEGENRKKYFQYWREMEEEHKIPFTNAIKRQGRNGLERLILYL